jgi:hypothetical protein
MTRRLFASLLIACAAAAVAAAADWNQWGGSAQRNNTPDARNLAADWAPGDFDPDTGAWKPETSKNVAWVAALGSQTYGNPVVAGGRVYVGSNNGKGWLKRYPPAIDLGCLLAFDTRDGSFLWQDSSEKLPTGRVHDWPLQGICCAPLVEGDRLWYVTSRGEVKCLDTEGFRDGENDGPVTNEKVQERDEADVVWVLDMMKQLGVSPRPVVEPGLRRAGRRAAGAVRRRRRLALRLRRPRRRRQGEAALGIRLQPEGVEVHARRPGRPQPHHRHAGRLRRPRLRGRG